MYIHIPEIPSFAIVEKKQARDFTPVVLGSGVLILLLLTLGLYFFLALDVSRGIADIKEEIQICQRLTAENTQYWKELKK